jgi:DNA-binding transcriptional MerR regulator
VTQRATEGVGLKWTKAARNWKGGSITDLVDRANGELESELDPIQAEDLKVSERLVRFYITRGLLPRPVKRGDKAFFTQHDLARLLLARKLSVRRSLNEISRSFELTSWDDYYRRLGLEPREEEKRVDELERGLGLASATEGTEDLEYPARTGLLVRVNLTSWCEVLFDAARAQRLSEESALELGRSLTEALMQYRTEYRNRKEK